MKFYPLFIATIALFQSFSCLCMEIKPTKKKIRPAAKKYRVKEELIIFPTPIPKEFQTYFLEPKEKMTFSKEIKDEIIEMCATNRKIQEYEKTLILARKENDALLKEGETIRRKTADSLQQLTELRQKTQELSQKQAEPIQKATPITPKSNELSSRESWQIEKYFWKQISDLRGINPEITKRKDLIEALKDLCYDIYFNKPIKNNPDNGPYFDNIVHQLVMPVKGKKCTCVFSPCMHRIKFIPEYYSELKKKTIEVDSSFLCSKCTNYAPSSSSSSDTEQEPA